MHDVLFINGLYDFYDIRKTRDELQKLLAKLFSRINVTYY